MTTAPGPGRRPPGRRFGLAGRWPGLAGRWPGLAGHGLGLPGRWFRLPERWIRPPRRTVRLRLTAVYGGLFLLLGAALLGITYLLVSKQLPSTPGKAGTSTSVQSGSGVFVRAVPGNCRLSASPPMAPSQLQTRAQK